MRLEPQVISLIQLCCNVFGHTEWRLVTQNQVHLSALAQARSCAFGLLFVWQNTVSLKTLKDLLWTPPAFNLSRILCKWIEPFGGGLTIQGVNVQLNNTAFSWTLLFHCSYFSGIFSIKMSATVWSQIPLCSISLLLFIPIHSHQCGGQQKVYFITPFLFIFRLLPNFHIIYSCITHIFLTSHHSLCLKTFKICFLYLVTYTL